jgi:APA family basic amino acid/polyamine antiporter
VTVQPPSRLDRRIGTADAVVIGLASMIGAGVFAAWAPAAQRAGSGLLVGLAIAGVVAFANATSSAQLAARHPQAGGSYVYGRARLGPAWGFVAGWGFVVGKTASCAAMALTFGAYSWPRHARPMAALAIVAMVSVNLRGITRTVWMTRITVLFVLTALTIVIVGGWAGGTADIDRLDINGASPFEWLRAGSLLFFAFAGYARIATLGEEVRDPEHVIPRAIPLALGFTLIVYTLVGVAALAAVGAPVLAANDAPLATVLAAGSWDAAEPIVRVGAAVASLGVLLSLLAGVSRTAFAMARDGELPRALGRVHPRTSVPDVGEIVIGGLALCMVAVGDVRDAIGFSSFCVLSYYAITNAAALRLPRAERRWPAPLAVLGLVGCLALAGAVPVESLVSGAAVIAAGLAIRAVVRRIR